MFPPRSNPTPWKCPSKPTERHGLPRLIGILDLVQQRQIIDYKTAPPRPTPRRSRTPRDPDQQLRHPLPSQHGQPRGRRAAPSPGQTQEPQGGHHPTASHDSTAANAAVPADGSLPRRPAAPRLHPVPRDALFELRVLQRVPPMALTPQQPAAGSVPRARPCGITPLSTHETSHHHPSPAARGCPAACRLVLRRSSSASAGSRSGIPREDQLS
jgi:hypothetical protein